MGNSWNCTLSVVGNEHAHRNPLPLLVLCQSEHGFQHLAGLASKCQDWAMQCQNTAEYLREGKRWMSLTHMGYTYQDSHVGRKRQQHRERDRFLFFEAMWD